MKDGITWVILTDGNYIKIMFNKVRGDNLKTLREGDFEHTSEIAYKMVTRKRALTLNKLATLQDEQSFFLKLLADFLNKQQEINAFQYLTLVAPGDITDIIKGFLPETVNKMIISSVKADYLQLSQDKIQTNLSGNY